MKKFTPGRLSEIVTGKTLDNWLNPSSQEGARVADTCVQLA